jgi:glutamate synthase (ferredoxin)
MSGGIAWVLDGDGTFASRANAEMVTLEPLAGGGADGAGGAAGADDAGAAAACADEIAEVRALVERHADLTGSERAIALLDDWAGAVGAFVRVIPNDYRRVLETQARMRAVGHSEVDAEMAAFAENVADLARVGGS